MQAVVDVEEWVSKEIAAGILELSERRVLEYAKAGVIRSRNEPHPKGQGKGGRLPIVLNAGDVRKLKLKREGGEVEAQGRALASVGGALSGHPRHFQLALPAPAAEAAPRETRWLTLDECAEYTGLPKSVIVGLIRQGAVKVLRVPRNGADADPGARGGTWRVKRAELDAIEGQSLT